MRELTSGAVPGVFANAFFGNRMNFIVALSAVPIRLAGIDEGVLPLMLGAIPTVIAERRVVGIITRAGTFVAIGAIPVTRCTSFVCGMMRCIFGTIPGVCAGFFGRATLLTLVTPPVMRATLRLGVSVDTFGAEPTCVRAIFFNAVMYLFAGRTNPIMQTACRIVQHRCADRAVAITLRTGEIKRMPRLATGTVPEVRAGFADFVRGSTRRVRTIPAIGRCRDADIIGFVMFAAGCAIPVVGAIFVRCKDTFAGTAKTIPGVHTDRNGRRMYPVAPRMTP